MTMTGEQTHAMVTVDAPLTARVPTTTYRWQFNRTFTFQDARNLVAYLNALGVSDVYASPYFKAREESTHGYDIADHNKLNPSVGTVEDYHAFVEALHARGMGQVLDVVPNHMGIGEPSNTLWMDVLENGPSSIYAPFFDIDWHPLKKELANKVLLPVLGDQYGRVLEKGELKLRYLDGAFYLDYWETQLPINPRTYVEVLRVPLDELIGFLGPEDENVLEYQSIITALDHLPPRTETERARVVERRREKEIIKRRLATLTERSMEIHAAIEATVTQFNGAPGDPRSFDLLDLLIDRQAYRLSYWRVAAEEINYRRFFDINDLAAIRMERPEVFEESHRLLLQLLGNGDVTGLRLDHTDGLYDPAGYFRQLQEAYVGVRQQGVGSEKREAGGGKREAAESALSPISHPPYPDPRPLYILAEKILGRGETLPSDWAIAGTTGYDFMNDLNGVFVDTSAQKLFDDIYHEFTAMNVRLDELVYASKKQIMSLAMASEVNVLAEQLSRIAERNRYYRDFTLYSLRAVLREVIACFSVYRTYIVAERDEVSERDRGYINIAIQRAKRRNPALEPSIFNFLSDILNLTYPDTQDDEARDAQRAFVMKFQQVTGPVTAKGVEDTAFYVYNRLISLNEVGGEPQRFGLSVAQFHRQNAERLRDWPHTMLSSSTHDTKRSEDVRARINVLSELPVEWRKALRRWSRLNTGKKIEVDGELAPDSNEEYLLYQTLLGVWPFELQSLESRARHHGGDGAGSRASALGAGGDAFIERIQEYMVKAVREAKVHTSWLNPNNAYDEAVRAFVAAILQDRRFISEMQALRRNVAHFGAFNALAQTLLKFTTPGVPDIYQGNEMWELSLVDPDNRRPVDYDLRKWLLFELIDLRIERPVLARRLTETKEDGRIKLYLTHRALGFRREHAFLFRAGDYVPLSASGDFAEHIIAFARRSDVDEAITVVPRLLAKRLNDAQTLPLGAAVWHDALLVLPDVQVDTYYRNIFTDEIIAAIERDGVVGLPLAAVLANFPVALLEKVAIERQTAGVEDQHHTARDQTSPVNSLVHSS